MFRINSVLKCMASVSKHSKQYTRKADGGFNSELASWSTNIRLIGRHNVDSCFIQHKRTQQYLHVSEDMLSVSPLREPNQALINRHFLRGFLRGRAVCVLLINKADDCGNHSNFLSLKDGELVFDEDKFLPGRSLNALDPRVFLHRRVINGLSIIESGSKRGWFLSVHRGDVRLKRVPARRIANDPDLHFQIYNVDLDTC